MKGKWSWIAILAAIAFAVLIIVLMARFWAGLGDTGMSTAGWIALVLGVAATLALGVGLMALVFISNRRGYDELDRGGR
jgi:hypothetical protein